MIDTLSIILRALSFIAIFQATGMAIFLAVFDGQLDVTAPRVRRMTIAATLGALILVAAHFALEPARMGDGLAALGDSTLWDVVLHTSLTTAFAWRVAGLTLLLVGLLLGNSTGLVLRLLGVAVTLSAFTQIGHTKVFEPRPLLGGLLFVHILIVAFWFGALLPLIAVVRHEATAVAASMVEAFSRIALRIVPLLLVAGLGLALLLLHSWAAVRSAYGLLLIVKLGLFAALLGLAALNRWRYGPALANDQPPAQDAFCRIVIAEMVLISAALAVTAALTTLYSPDP